MQLNDIQRTTKNRSKKIVGRGGRRGKTSGRGMKGQGARAGNKKRPELRDRIKKIPKLRGHGKNSNPSIVQRPATLTLARIETLFDTGAVITRALLLEKKVIRRAQGALPQVKILATGTLTKKVTVIGMELSTKAKEAILAAGGTVK
jgi:large subunit ribosomal protein L15